MSKSSRAWAKGLKKIEGRSIVITTHYSPVPPCRSARFWKLGRLSITWAPKPCVCTCHKRAAEKISRAA